MIVCAHIRVQFQKPKWSEMNLCCMHARLRTTRNLDTSEMARTDGATVQREPHTKKLTAMWKGQRAQHSSLPTTGSWKNTQWHGAVEGTPSAPPQKLVYLLFRWCSTTAPIGMTKPWNGSPKSPFVKCFPLCQEVLGISQVATAFQGSSPPFLIQARLQRYGRVPSSDSANCFSAVPLVSDARAVDTQWFDDISSQDIVKFHRIASMNDIRLFRMFENLSRAPLHHLRSCRFARILSSQTLHRDSNLCLFLDSQILTEAPNFGPKCRFTSSLSARALVFSDRLQTSQFRSLGKWVPRDCFLDAYLWDIPNQSHGKCVRVLALLYLRGSLWTPPNILGGLACGLSLLVLCPQFCFRFFLGEDHCIGLPALVFSKKNAGLGDVLGESCENDVEAETALELQANPGPTKGRNLLSCVESFCHSWSDVAFDHWSMCTTVLFAKVANWQDEQACHREIAPSWRAEDREHELVLHRSSALHHSQKIPLSCSLAIEGCPDRLSLNPFCSACASMLGNLLRILCPLASSKRVPTLPTLRWTSRTWTFSGQVPCFSVGDSLLLQSFPKCPTLKFWRTSIAFTLLMLEREWEKDAFNSMGYHLRLAPAETVVKPTVPSLICHPPQTHQEWQRGQHPIRDCTFSKAEQMAPLLSSRSVQLRTWTRGLFGELVARPSRGAGIFQTNRSNSCKQSKTRVRCASTSKRWRVDHVLLHVRKKIKTTQSLGDDTHALVTTKVGAKHGPRTTLGPLYRWVAILARRHGLETKTSANADVRPHTLVNVNTTQSTQRTEQLKRKQIRTNQNCTTQHYTRQHDTTNPNSILMSVGTLIDKLITYQLSISISFHTTNSQFLGTFSWYSWWRSVSLC